MNAPDKWYMKNYWDKVVFEKCHGLPFQTLTLFLGELGTLLLILSATLLCTNNGTGFAFFGFFAIFVLFLYVLCGFALYKIKAAPQRLLLLYDWLNSCGLYKKEIIEKFIHPDKEGLSFNANDIKKILESNSVVEKIIKALFTVVLGGGSAASIISKSKGTVTADGLFSIMKLVAIILIIVLIVVAFYSIVWTTSMGHVVETCLKKDLKDILLMLENNVDVREACRNMDEFDKSRKQEKSEPTENPAEDEFQKKLKDIKILPPEKVIDHYYQHIYYDRKLTSTDRGEAGEKEEKHIKNKASVLLIASGVCVTLSLAFVGFSLIFSPFLVNLLLWICISVGALIASLIFFGIVVHKYFKRQKKENEIIDVVVFLHEKSMFKSSFLECLKNSIPDKSGVDTEDELTAGKLLSTIGGILSATVPALSLVLDEVLFPSPSDEQKFIMACIYIVIYFVIVIYLCLKFFPMTQEAVDDYGRAEQRLRSDVVYILDNLGDFQEFLQNNEEN